MLKLVSTLWADRVFDPETIQILVDAFDEAWKSVQASETSFVSERYVVTPIGVSNALRPFDQRLISHVPANAANNVPTPMEPAAKSERATIAWKKTNPAKLQAKFGTRVTVAKRAQTQMAATTASLSD